MRFECQKHDQAATVVVWFNHTLTSLLVRGLAIDREPQCRLPLLISQWLLTTRHFKEFCICLYRPVMLEFFFKEPNRALEIYN